MLLICDQFDFPGGALIVVSLWSIGFKLSSLFELNFFLIPMPVALDASCQFKLSSRSFEYFFCVINCLVRLISVVRCSPTSVVHCRPTSVVRCRPTSVARCCPTSHFLLRRMTLLWCCDLCADVTIWLPAAAASPRVATVHCRAIATGLLVGTSFIRMLEPVPRCTDPYNH